MKAPRLVTMEELLEDLKIAQKELDAYLDLEKAYITLANLPDQNSINKKKYSMEAILYRHHAVECNKTLIIILNAKKKMEEE